MIMVNLGCGTRFHAAWINLDSVPSSPAVKRWDVRERLPFEDGSVDVVYHSHLLEHLPSAEGTALLRECHRILRPGGIVRIVVPDLEGIARAYLAALEEAAKGGSPVLHAWTRMELIDQASRSISGGEMVPWLRQLGSTDLDQIRGRAGYELDSILKTHEKVSGWRRLAPGRVFGKIRKEFVRNLVYLLGGPALRAALDEGVFRQHGEVHRVMYDQVALSLLALHCGFSEAQAMKAGESRIPNFVSFELDAIKGLVRKPDSLFLEAIKR